jgi:hypothetical protein
MLNVLEKTWAMPLDKDGKNGKRSKGNSCTDNYDGGSRANRQISVHASIEKRYIGLPGTAMRRSSHVLYSIAVSTRVQNARPIITDILLGASKIHK